MTSYRAPVTDMQFVLNKLAGLPDLSKLPGLEDTSEYIVTSVLEEAGRFAADVLAPLNRRGDLEGAGFKEKAVISTPGFAAAYQGFVEGGWQTLPFSPALGGQGLPEVVAVAVNEIWQSANMSFALCPLLTEGAIVALNAHADDELQQKYMPKMISGEWTGTMNLTESQAGSDLAAVKTRAVPEGDHYRITGQKIFITWGDHDFADNIIHMVLARTPDAPPGIKGISLFLVPKFVLNEDGSPGERNDVYPVSIEHKLGIHASPTCVMSYGDNGGAIGYLVGDLHDGIGCMFTMMNHARIAVGIQGLSISERAWQQAAQYATEREQGQAPGKKDRATLIDHADVRRMLLLMKAGIEAMRAIIYTTTVALDYLHHATDAELKQSCTERFALLTPVVKGWSTELAQELTYLGVQVHGGMGFIEETGAAQHYRDARIVTIYEGTTGIQAQDLVGRKIIRDNGKAVTDLITEMRAVQTSLQAKPEALQVIAANLAAAIDDLEAATRWLLDNHEQDSYAAGSSAVNFLMLMGTVCGGWQMARAAAIAAAEDTAFNRNKLITARFYAEHFLPRTKGYLGMITAGSESIMALKADQFL
ncbi:MAG: acyl-CoA dehydrogenase [Gammaproteobacteria bacterium]